MGCGTWETHLQLGWTQVLYLCLFCIFYLFVVDKGVSLAPTYSYIVIRKSDLRSSFLSVDQVILFTLRGDHFKALDLVATYPSAGGQRVTRGCVFQERNTPGVATNVYLRKTPEKPGKT